MSKPHNTLKFAETTGIDLPNSPIDESLSIDQLLGFDENYNGAINGALELIFSAPAFDHINAHELEAALGSGIHAVVTYDDRTIIATNGSYEPSEPISATNNPLTRESVIHPQDVLVEYQGYIDETSQHEFKTPTGEPIKVDTGDLAEYLSPS